MIFQTRRRKKRKQDTIRGGGGGGGRAGKKGRTKEKLPLVFPSDKTEGTPDIHHPLQATGSWGMVEKTIHGRVHRRHLWYREYVAGRENYS
jgi:hypothetical protein